MSEAALDEQTPSTDDVNATADTTDAEANTQADPAPATDEGGEFVETESDKVQARINKITADKYAEKRRADAAQAELDQLRANQPAPTQAATGEPKLEDFDYDESAHMAAMIDYKVNQKAAEIQQQQQQQVQAQKSQEAVNTFQQKATALREKAPDFDQVVASVPTLPQDTLDAVMQHEKGPELAYYLGKHLDVADEIVNMSPVSAAMKLGQISAQLSAPTQTKATSAAPDPINPISTGGTVSDEITGPPGAKYE